uniref:Zona pellucida protein AX 4 n=1 Tax=Cyprinodon variegatus TaxID=28743 RepID=A0A3Q2CGG8_CYPVA
MAFELMFSVALLLSLWSTAGCDFVVEGVLQMECHDRYFMIAVDLTATGEAPRFEAVDRTGAYAITEDYAAKCGYSVSVLSFLGLVELRASYFSCHTERVGGFSFRFNLITSYDGVDAYYELNKTCPLPPPWSPREVTCEVNYMEVSVRSELPCPSGLSDDFSSLSPLYSASTQEWQVTFQSPEEQMPPMNLSQARQEGYVFDIINDRIVFRTPYGQPESYGTELNGVPVEVIHATVFSRQSWIVVMVDLVAACSMDEGSFEGGYMIWDTPEALYPSLGSTKISLGLDGNLVEQAAAEQAGFIMARQNSTVQIGIPYNAKGGYRKSYVSNGIFEFYIFNLYLKQISVDEHHEETALRFHRTLVTPLLPSSLFTEDQTDVKEGTFTIYLGKVPRDVVLTSVKLNGHEFAVPLSDTSAYTLTEVSYPNKTHSYTLKVLLNDPIVIQEFSKENAAMLHKLDINYTLIALPGDEPYHHTVSVTALMAVSPPAFDANCTASGIDFKLAYRPFDYLWYISIGPHRLTPALAAMHGYTMSNDSQRLLLSVPLFTHGYKYQNVSLKGFLGTFTILMRDRDTSEVQTSTIKTCLFNTTEFIMCSTTGWMTVVADLSLVLHEIPTKPHLINRACLPKEVDGTRVLFSFPLHSCGSIVKLEKGNVTYQNKIYFVSNNVTEGITVQCRYPLVGLYRLFSAHKFESDKEGVGSIIPFVDHAKAPARITAETTTVAPRRTRSPNLHLPPFYPTARYIKVYRVQNQFGSFGKGEGQNS